MGSSSWASSPGPLGDNGKGACAAATHPRHPAGGRRRQAEVHLHPRQPQKGHRPGQPGPRSRRRRVGLRPHVGLAASQRHQAQQREQLRRQPVGLRQPDRLPVSGQDRDLLSPRCWRQPGRLGSCLPAQHRPDGASHRPPPYRRREVRLAPQRPQLGHARQRQLHRPRSRPLPGPVPHSPRLGHRRPVPLLGRHCRQGRAGAGHLRRRPRRRPKRVQRRPRFGHQPRLLPEHLRPPRPLPHQLRPVLHHGQGQGRGTGCVLHPHPAARQPDELLLLGCAADADCPAEGHRPEDPPERPPPHPHRAAVLARLPPRTQRPLPALLRLLAQPRPRTPHAELHR
jgi:hypothetical protein